MSDLIKTYRFRLIFLVSIIILSILLLGYFLWLPTFVNNNKIEEFQRMPSENELLEKLQLYTSQNKKLSIFFTNSHSKEIHQVFIEEIHKNIIDRGLNLSIQKTSSIYKNTVKDYTSSTFYVEVSGSYRDMIRLCNHIEDDIEYVKLKSTEFYTEFNYQLKTKKLYCKYYVQRIQK